jgi:hypothetical protein
MNAVVKRVPMPVVYEAACKALAEVSTVLDAKYFSDKADALATWAKIYKSDEAAVAAKRLKIHAYRKMGEIAEQLQPTSRRSLGRGKGSSPGANSLLMENGLTVGQANIVLRVSRVPVTAVKEFLDMPRPPSIHTVAYAGRGLGTSARSLSSDAYYRIFGNYHASETYV